MPKLPQKRRGDVICVSLSQYGRRVLEETANALGTSMSRATEIALLFYSAQLINDEKHPDIGAALSKKLEARS